MNEKKIEKEIKMLMDDVKSHRCREKTGNLCLDCEINMAKANGLYQGFQAGKSQTIQEVRKLLDEGISKIKELRKNITSNVMLNPTERNTQKYHVFEITELENIKAKLE